MNGLSVEPEAARAVADYEAHVRPRVAQMLHAVRMDVVFHRAEGDHLYYRNELGDEVQVLDLLGGFGATLLGHNHPHVCERAHAVLRAQRPFHAQASVRGASARLGRRLSDLVGRTTGASYVSAFASSGAEAVEAALKHAGAEYTNRLEGCLRQLREGVIRARRRWPMLSDPERARVLDATRAAFAEGASSFESAAQLVLEQASRLAATPPVTWALRRAFHGKTSGALRLTHNPKFRAPWAHLGSAIFLEPTSSEAVTTAAEAASLPYFSLDQGPDGGVQLEPRTFTTVLACFVEPLQGEGGIWEVPAERLRDLREAATRGGFPLVFDEIQSGLGRTGDFLASAASGVIADYYLFSKSLGAGLAKISAAVIDRARYIDEFGYLHTSTFAEDDWSCEVALAGLDLLEANGGALYGQCRDRGAYLKERLEALQKKFPRTVRDVRGRGLMLGLELDVSRPWRSRLLRVLHEQDLLGFMLAGYLLREKQVRLAPGLSANSTLRLEPSAYIGQLELDRGCAALEDMLAVLDSDDATEFARFLVDATAPREAAPASRSCSRVADASAPSP